MHLLFIFGKGLLYGVFAVYVGVITLYCLVSIFLNLWSIGNEIKECIESKKNGLEGK